MRRIRVAVAGFVFAIALSAPLAASAAGDRFILNISPVFFSDATGDSSAPPLHGYVPVNCPGYAGQLGAAGPAPCPGTPRTTSDLNLDYGLTYLINPKMNIAYSHSTFDFTLGRISVANGVAPGIGESIESGDVEDRTDQITFNYVAGHGLGLDLYWASHQRDNIAATSFTQTGCFFNAENCIGGGSNPSSIDSRYYGAGLSYAFGPHTRFEPPMFKVTVDANYYPRPSNPAACGTAGAEAACNTNGVNGYRGSGVTFPYGITLFPFSATHLTPGFIPFIGYNRLIAWFHPENVPETYNAVAYGFVKVLPHGLTLSYTNFRLNQCYCYAIPGLAPPDAIRSDVNIFKLSYDLRF